MTLLSDPSAQTEVPLRQARHECAQRAAAVATHAHLTAIKRFCVIAFTVMLAGGTVAGIFSLRTAVDLFSY
jgi:hypothetical protein